MVVFHAELGHAESSGDDWIKKALRIIEAAESEVDDHRAKLSRLRRDYERSSIKSRNTFWDAMDASDTQLPIARIREIEESKQQSLAKLEHTQAALLAAERKVELLKKELSAAMEEAEAIDSREARQKAKLEEKVLSRFESILERGDAPDKNIIEMMFDRFRPTSKGNTDSDDGAKSIFAPLMNVLTNRRVESTKEDERYAAIERELLRQEQWTSANETSSRVATAAQDAETRQLVASTPAAPAPARAEVSEETSRNQTAAVADIEPKSVDKPMETPKPPVAIEKPPAPMPAKVDPPKPKKPERISPPEPEPPAPPARVNKRAVGTATNVLVVDTFDVYSDYNNLGNRTNTYQREPSTAAFDFVDDKIDGKPTVALKIDFFKQNEGGPYQKGGWCGYYSVLKNQDAGSYLDVSSYDYVSFQLKGETGHENFVIGLADKRWEMLDDSVKSNPVTAYLPSGKITTEWQKVRIPLKNLSLNFSYLASISINFESICFPTGGGRGAVFIDDLAFE